MVLLYRHKTSSKKKKKNWIHGSEVTRHTDLSGLGGVVTRDTKPMYPTLVR